MPRERALWILGYTVFSLFSLFAALYLTFPTEAVAERLSFDIENRTQGALSLKIGELDLAGISGIEAENVRLGLGFMEPALPVVIDEFRAGFGLLPLVLSKLDFRADAVVGDGQLKTSVQSGEKSGISLAAGWRNIDLNAPPILSSLTGVPLSGVLSGEAKLSWAQTVNRANGSFSVGFENLELGAGEVFPGFAIGTPLGTGKLMMSYEAKNGTFLLSDFEQSEAAQGGAPALSLELVEARIKLNKMIQKTTFDTCVKFKLEDEYLNRKENKDLKRALDLLNLQFRKDPEGYFHAALSGDFSFGRNLRVRKRLCKSTK